MPPTNPSRDSVVSLREITAATLEPVLSMRVGDHQTSYVATNAVSIAQAHFEPKAWFRAIDADDVPVGFAMLEIEPGSDQVLLWRFLIDHRFQGLGIGSRALKLLMDHARTLQGVQRFVASTVPGEHTPRPFYERNGFTFTGELHDGEEVLSQAL